MKATLLVATFLLCLGQSVWAQEGDEDRPPSDRRGPPPEALTACEDLAAGDTCSFEGRNGTETGVCSAPEDRPLACVPANRRQSADWFERNEPPAPLASSADVRRSQHCDNH